jgi:2-C-methyl-D-erythritol 4-phosphate cytidylyltransferase/2-C-methyl-D-erythritol 4-phosphate cytidylyltransferase/2-C-methyl-D-erythritol 2,4-cyclodiphosphate synthase
MDVPAIAAIITAAGSSSRMGGIKKEYCPLLSGHLGPDGKPLSVLGAAALAFTASPRISLIVITVPVDMTFGEAAARACLPSLILETGRPPIRFVSGGPTRRASVHKALAFLADGDTSYVLIHDGARPWVDGNLIERTIDAVLQHKAIIPLVPVTDTPKELDGDGFITRHLTRSRIGLAQTPQAFAYPAILRAHEQAAVREERDGWDYTDDAEVWGEFQGPVAVIPGSPANRKITFPKDLAP